jgi:hypothetical protein
MEWWSQGVLEYCTSSVLLQPTPYPLPIGVILRTEMLLHELFFEGDQPEINKPEKNDRRSNEPEGFYSQKAPDGNE